MKKRDIERTRFIVGIKKVYTSDREMKYGVMLNGEVDITFDTWALAQKYVKWYQGKRKEAKRAWYNKNSEQFNNGTKSSKMDIFLH